jgi:protein-L-isoaspartate(D-aspartate) O-methyltransferase
MSSQQELIALLKAEGVLSSPAVVKAMKTVDRADFVLPQYRNSAYENYPLPLGFGQTISQPLTVSLMLQWLGAKKGDKVLDIGCGSGWTTALLTSIVGKKGKVIGIERIPELAEFAKKNLQKFKSNRASLSDEVTPRVTKSDTIVQGDGSKGYPKAAPFNRILVSASAKTILPAWKEQLKIGGRIVASVGESIVVVNKLTRNEYRTTKHRGFVFVPLVEG